MPPIAHSWPNKPPHPDTLFHLVPVPDNERTVQLLRTQPNHRLISKSQDLQDGFEVGFHSSGAREPELLARVGNDPNRCHIVINDPSSKTRVSHVDLSFLYDRDFDVVYVKNRSIASLTIKIKQIPAPNRDGRQTGPPMANSTMIIGQYTLSYEDSYILTIMKLEFEVKWNSSSPAELRRKALKGYQDALAGLVQRYSREQSTVEDRLCAFENFCEMMDERAEEGDPGNFAVVKEALGARRELISKGAFAEVFRTRDAEHGKVFAIKVMKLNGYSSKEDLQVWRKAIHREVKNMCQLKHPSIIKCWGFHGWDSLQPEIYMRCCDGNLSDLAKTGAFKANHQTFCDAVLFQMLSALAYVHTKLRCHRDVKPHNILFIPDDSTDLGYRFLLADFGLARDVVGSVTACAGTRPFMAPEMRPDEQPEDASYSKGTKADIWSLGITYMAIHPGIEFSHTAGWDGILAAIREAKKNHPILRSMLVEDPERRASAAELLDRFFDGQGKPTQPQATTESLDEPPLKFPNIEINIPFGDWSPDLPMPEDEPPLRFPNIEINIPFGDWSPDLPMPEDEPLLEGQSLLENDDVVEASSSDKPRGREKPTQSTSKRRAKRPTARMMYPSIRYQFISRPQPPCTE